MDIQCEDGWFEEKCEPKNSEDEEMTTERDPLLRKRCVNASSESDPSFEYFYMSKQRSMKNLLVISLSIFLVFLGFQSLSNLQSTMNSIRGVGTDSLAVMYGFAMISALFLPKTIISWFGTKNTIITMALLGLPYIAANFYPVWQVLIPSAVFIGIATGPLSAADFVYINGIAHRYKSHVPDQMEVISSRFYSIHAFFTENTQIWGNLISYLVLRPTYSPSDIVPNNVSVPKCGVNFVPLDLNATNGSNPNLLPPTDEQRYLLVGIYTAVCLTSVFLMMFCLDPLPTGASDSSSSSSAFQNFMATIRQIGNVDQILLLPVTVYTGLELAFYTGDFTKAYIACSWGIYHVGFVTICFGVCASLTALLLGPAVRLCGQTSIIILAFVISMTNCTLLFFWTPDASNSLAYFVFAGVWGATDAIWWSQISALYGVTFPKNSEAAFSNFFFWTSTGFFLSYLSTNYVTIPVKLAILLGLLVMGLVGYSVCQLRRRCSSSLKYELLIDG